MMRSRTDYISADTMEMTTQTILQEYGFELQSNSINPIPIDEIIEFQFELDITWERIDHLDDEHESVMAAIVPAERKIILNDSFKTLFEEKSGILNFTLAHELGHWVLHAKEYHDHSQSSLYFRGLNKKPIHEVQADLFAGCILMPRLMLVRMIKLMKWRGAIHMPHLYELAELFQVSISALCVRLEQLNLLYVDSSGAVLHSKNAKQRQLTFDF